jgi:hypothetical protein
MGKGRNSGAINGDEKGIFKRKDQSMRGQLTDKKLINQYFFAQFSYLLISPQTIDSIFLLISPNFF